MHWAGSVQHPYLRTASWQQIEARGKPRWEMGCKLGLFWLIPEGLPIEAHWEE